jgi:hypothetical protein
MKQRLSRRKLLQTAAVLGVAAAGGGVATQFQSAHATTTFMHPGMLYTRADLDGMKAKVAAKLSPWLEEWKLLLAHPLASISYTPTYSRTVYRNDAIHGYSGNADLQCSATAVLLDAIAWYITRNQAYADKAIAILDGWSSTLTSIQGHDAQLVATLYGYKLLNAAEILRYSGAGWSSTGIANFTALMQNTFYPVCKGFGYVNGGWANGGWDACNILFLLSLGVWSNNAAMFESAVAYYKRGTGNGSLTHYIQTSAGQTQESGRDQAHTQLGLAVFMMCAKIGYNQRSVNTNGANMYSYPNNTYLLLRGLEYTAKYNLGYSVPYTSVADVSGASYSNISALDRGMFRPMYEMAYSFYKNTIGVADASIAYTLEVLNRVKLEGMNYDHPSYGGLLDAHVAFSNRGQSTVVLQVESKVLAGAAKTMVNVSNTSMPLAVTASSVSSANSRFIRVYTGTANHFALKSLLTFAYVTVESDGTLLANASSIGPAQTFARVDIGTSSETIQAVANGKYVTMDASTFVLYATASSITDDNGRLIMLFPAK